MAIFISLFALCMACSAFYVSVMKRKEIVSPSVIIEECSEGATMLRKAHENDASFDLCVNRNYVLKKGVNILPTGIKVKFPKAIHAFIMPTSGNSSKGMNARLKMKDGKIVPLRARGVVRIGTIDNNYRGELGVMFYCDEDCETDLIFIEKGTKVAQLWIVREEPVVIMEGEVNADSSRGTNAFGSTDRR